VLEVRVELSTKVGLATGCHQEVNPYAETFTGDAHQELEEFCLIGLFLEGFIAI